MLIMRKEVTLKYERIKRDLSHTSRAVKQPTNLFRHQLKFLDQVKTVTELSLKTMTLYSNF